MPSTKEFDVKLASLKNTRKMTYTMKLVSMSKLYRAQENQRRAKLYAEKITEIACFLDKYLHDASGHPLMNAHEKKETAHILLITSDRGLCGGFNNSIIQTVEAWIAENREQYKNIKLSCCGKRGFIYFKKQLQLQKNCPQVAAKPDFQSAKQIGDDLIEGFANGHFDEVFLAYNAFHSPLLQTATFEKILPIDSQDILTSGKDIPAPGDCIFEPAENELLDFLIPKYLYFRIYFALLENSAGEHGARMTAMENATKNASELIKKYTLFRNRARQTSITTELTEITTGAEALNQG